MTIFLATLTLLMGIGSFADASPGITYHGRLLKPNGQAVTSTSVQFKVQIRTPLPSNCLLYEEIHTKDLSSSAGTFSVTINDGTATVLNTEPYTLDRVFQNRGTFNFTAGKCAGSDSEYTPNATDGRSLYVAFNDGSFADWEPLPSQAINFVPAALESVTVGGHKPSNFFRVVDSGTLHTLGPWSLANYQKLVDLIANTTISGGNASIGGNAAGFTGSLSGDVTGGQTSTRVEKIQGFDVSNGLPSNGQVLTWNNAGSRWEPVTPSSSATPSGPASGDLSGTYPGPVIANSAVTTTKISDGAITTSKLQDGSADGQIFRFDGTDWQIAKLNYRDLINNVSGSPWPLASCTAGQAVVWLSASDAFSCQSIAIDGSNIVDGSVDTVDLADGSVTTPKIQDGAVTNQKIVSVAVSKITSGPGLYLTYAPNNVACSNNEVLKWDAGNSRWICGSDNNAGGTVTSVSGTAPISVATGTTTPVISLNAAGVTNTHLANDAVTTGKILDGTILNADIADGTITATKLATSVTDGLWSSGSGNVYRSTGNVGIGMSNPGFPLDIYKAATQLHLSTGANNGAYFYGGPNGNYMSGNAEFTGSSWIARSTSTSSLSLESGNLRFFSNSGLTAGNTFTQTERMRIDQDGRVGLGTVSPLAKLQVAYAGNLLTDYTARFQSSSSVSGAGGILFDQNSTYSYKVHTFGTSALGGKMIFSYIDPSTGAVINDNNLVLSSGNVGIGVAAPADKLDVAGRIRATHICAADGTNCKDLTTGWTAGTVTSVSGTAPISVTGTSTPVVSLNAAGVTNTHLANDAVTSAKILDGTIVTADLADASVTNPKIVSMSVDKISSGAGLYLTYAPNGAACTNGQVLKKTANGWECGADNNAGGTVTSVGLALPSIFTVSGSPVTTSGTLTGTLATQAQNTVFAGPLSGTAAPSFRTLQIADIKSSVSGNFLTGSSCAANQGLVYSSVSDTISCQTISGTTPAGAAGGDLTGNYPNPTIAASAVTSAKILDGTIATADLANGAVTSAKILDGTIATVDVANLAITDAKIDGVNVSKIDSGVGLYFTYAPNNAACTAGQILKWNNSRWECGADNNAGGTVTTVGATAPLTVTNPTTTPTIAITNGTVTGQMLRWNGTAWQASTDGSALTALNASNLSSGSLPAARIAAGTITSSHILDATIATADLANGAVNSAKILDNSIVAADIAPDAITASELATGAVTTTEILDGTIAAVDLATGAVTGAKILDGTITAADLANGAVTGAKILDDTITAADLAPAVANGLWTVSGANINRPSGNVGVGVASPAQKLEVLGNVKATAFISTSDRRLKRNIATVDGIEKVLKLRGVEFDWRANGEHEIGLIAQEVEAVYPDLVVTDPNTGYKAVKYSSLVSPLIEATKDLYGMCKAHDDQIKRLQAENAALKAKNQELENRLEAIERRLGMSK